MEFSTAFAPGEPPIVRMIIEPQARKPGNQENLAAALDVLDRLAAEHDVELDRFNRVRDLFLPDEPHGPFGLWFSLVVKAGEPPAIKIYLNPQIRGEERSPDLVREALTRLGLGDAWARLEEHALSRGSDVDRCAYFALDLVDPSRARVKVYVSHEMADEWQLRHAARAALDDVDDELLRDFCEIAGGGTGPFTRRAFISSYTFLADDTDRPSGYSLYVPVRDYVQDDVEARERVLGVLTRYGLDQVPFLKALGSMTHRPLDEGVGLIAHVSLRMGRPRPGVTTYLSSEAFAVTPTRTMSGAR